MGNESRPLFSQAPSDHKVAERFIMPSSEMLSALVASRLRDENYALIVSQYLTFMGMFNEDDGFGHTYFEGPINGAIGHLNALRAVNGIANNLAAMTADGIFFADAVGMPMNKDQRKTLSQIHQQRQQQQQNHDHQSREDDD